MNVICLSQQDPRQKASTGEKSFGLSILHTSVKEGSYRCGNKKSGKHFKETLCKNEDLIKNSEEAFRASKGYKASSVRLFHVTLMAEVHFLQGKGVRSVMCTLDMKNWLCSS